MSKSIKANVSPKVTEFLNSSSTLELLADILLLTKTQKNKRLEDRIPDDRALQMIQTRALLVLERAKYHLSGSIN